MFHLLKKAVELPKYSFDFLVDKHEEFNYLKNSSKLWDKLSFDQKILHRLQLKLTFTKPSATSLTQIDKKIVKEIRSKTNTYNQNNVTRTKAYLDFYKNHPEIHWAFLAHLVSRNGGWNMTDLKGSILPKIISESSQNDFFSFLERSNSLIFHDAFPQLLLYEASKQKNKNLFYLLPTMQVSQFMKPFWDYFFEKKDSQLLTVALIINEQSYLEKRVMQHPNYKKNVLDTILFRLQEWLQWTYVLFPFSITETKNRLAGVTVTNFANVRSRIETGKKLYSILFGIENIHHDVFTFATNVPHTGSRTDYWPIMFTNDRKQDLYTVSLSCRPKQPAIFSPTLTEAWSDVTHTIVETGDWFNQKDNILDYFSEVNAPSSFDLSFNYCQDLNKMIAASSTINIIQS